jgi:hypothetical protein
MREDGGIGNEEMRFSFSPPFPEEKRENELGVFRFPLLFLF